VPPQLVPREPLLIPQWPSDIVPPWYRRRSTLQRLGLLILMGVTLVLALRSVDWSALVSLIKDALR
jgi:hypothetical protein